MSITIHLFRASHRRSPGHMKLRGCCWPDSNIGGLVYSLAYRRKKHMMESPLHVSPYLSQLKSPTVWCMAGILPYLTRPKIWLKHVFQKNLTGRKSPHPLPEIRTHHRNQKPSQESQADRDRPPLLTRLNHPSTPFAAEMDGWELRNMPTHPSSFRLSIKIQVHIRSFKFYFG